MSWRDRLVRHDPADPVDAARRTTGANGTIGTIGNETLSTTKDHAAQSQVIAGGGPRLACHQFRKCR